jgi:hypothetical protein
MKIKVFAILLLSIISVGTLSAQNKAKQISPVGTWKFDAPYAPEGYNSGTIAVTLEDKKYGATMSFGTGEYKLPGEKVKAVKDSVLFSIFLEGQDINVFLKLEDESKMSGKAVYSEGEVPLTLKKVPVEGDVKK